MSFETFPNPPITEALLDIQVALPTEIGLSQLLEFQEPLRDRFPQKKERISWSQGFQLQPTGSTEVMPASSKVEGYLFVSSDSTKIAQARLSGFTFNKLKPYESWEKFSSEGKELWNKYLTLARPANIKRIALRYINRIEIPLPLKDFRDYCLLFPETPPQMPQRIAEFFLRFVTSDDDTGASSVVTLTLDPPPNGATKLPIILDIDVFFGFEVFPPDSSELWEKCTHLRQLKNRIFFSCLTESAKKLFR